MRRMKTYTFLSTVVTVFALATSALAVDGGSSARQGSLFNGESGPRLDTVYEGGPHRFSIGAYSLNQKRSITDDGDFAADWSVRHLMTYVGFDVQPWLTIQGGIGQSDLSVEGDSRDSDLEWMGGAQVRLLDYMLLEPIIGDDTYWFGLDSKFQYTSSKSEGLRDDLTWGEMFASLTLSLTSRPERYGFMDRISLFFGPAVSLIRGKEGDTDITEDQSFGFVGGLQFVPTDNLTFKFEIQQFGDMTIGGGVGLHF
jgi:opacity protein-like surface antigen